MAASKSHCRATRRGQIAHCKSKTLCGNFVCQRFKASSLPSFPFRITTIQVRIVHKPENSDQNHKTGHARSKGSVNSLPLLPMRHNYFVKILIIVASTVNVVSGNLHLGAKTNGTNKKPMRSICWSFCSAPVNGARFCAFASFQPTASGTKA